ncbi:MAG: hypothetical protein J1F35_04715 [Erysipelotrichales bacterium]|nr:hypothetical protein [Erysipelotrichales bacterium]
MIKKITKIITGLIKLFLQMIMLVLIFSFHNFIVSKITLGLILLAVASTIGRHVYFLIKNAINHVKFIKNIKSLNEEEVEKIEKDLETKINYTKNRLDAIQKVDICEDEVIFIDGYVPITDEISEVISSEEFESSYEEYLKKQKEILLENNANKRSKLKNELIVLSFNLQELATKSLISEKESDDMESLLQNTKVLKNYEKTAEKVKKYSRKPVR